MHSLRQVDSSDYSAANSDEEGGFWQALSKGM